MRTKCYKTLEEYIEEEQPNYEQHIIIGGGNDNRNRN